MDLYGLYKSNLSYNIGLNLDLWIGRHIFGKSQFIIFFDYKFKMCYVYFRK